MTKQKGCYRLVNQEFVLIMYFFLSMTEEINLSENLRLYAFFIITGVEYSYHNFFITITDISNTLVRAQNNFNMNITNKACLSYRCTV